MRSYAVLCVALLVPGFSTVGGSAQGAEALHKAGVASVTITPPAGLWMAGYASRAKPAEGKLHDLYAKALALEDARGTRLVLVTSDLIGFPRTMSEAIVVEVEKRYQLPRANIAFSASHTHCGPVLRDNLVDIYDMTPDQPPKLNAYADKLQSQVVDLVGAALKDLKPAGLAIGKGTARFAVNRRQVTAQGITNGSNPEGPVDHDVPVLKVETPDGKLRAVVFGYACHNTTLQFFQWCGDYAGFAQAYLEQANPGVTAMFWAGCGGDANPLPRSKVELCEKYGKELATAVNAVLAGSLTRVTGNLEARYSTIPLTFSTLPTRDRLVADTLSKNKSLKSRATRLLKDLDSGKALPDSYPHYPVQVWKLGDQVLWVILGGEVVVDYSHRLKKELGRDRPVWVMAYANDVMAYIPSVRVLNEGGYEGDTSMVGYGLPAKWAPTIEERIVGRVHEFARNLRW